ncbi:MAG: twin-arginine translocation signal domain-containing protein, partial [Gammaproteobacteria bacterium]
MKLIKRKPAITEIEFLRAKTGSGIGRRDFLRHSGLAAAGAAVAAGLPLTMMKKARADDTEAPEAADEIREVRSVCTHCSVGCGILAEVKNGVWIGQEPAFDHP